MKYGSDMASLYGVLLLSLIEVLSGVGAACMGYSAQRTSLKVVRMSAKRTRVSSVYYKGISTSVDLSAVILYPGY